MNNSWTRGTSALSSFETSNQGCEINNTTTTDSSGCPSRIYFSDTLYTLGFGHLFSGDLQNSPSFNSICQCYKSCSSNHTSQMGNIQCEQNLNISHKIDKAMETIRQTIKNIEKQHDYSTSSASYRYNPVMNNCNQNNIAKAAALLERAANAMSIAVNPSNQFR
jgi:hypothetical protein